MTKLRPIEAVRTEMMMRGWVLDWYDYPTDGVDNRVYWCRHTSKPGFETRNYANPNSAWRAAARSWSSETRAEEQLMYYLATCDGLSGLQLNWFASEQEAETAAADAERLYKQEGEDDWHIDWGEVPSGPGAVTEAKRP